MIKVRFVNRFEVLEAPVMKLFGAETLDRVPQVELHFQQLAYLDGVSHLDLYDLVQFLGSEFLIRQYARIG